MSALRVGVIGVGHLGKEHARILSGLPDLTLTGVADVNGVQAETVARRCGTKAYADYRPLLEVIDAVVIAVPTSQHHAVAGDVLRAGIPALVEKPLAGTLEQAEDLLASSRSRSVLLQVGHIERFNPAFEALRERPFTPKYVASERLGGYTGRSTDVGVVLDLMIHDIDLLLALVSSSITRVEALGVSVLGGPEDVATARVVFESGCVADLRASRVAAATLRRMQAWGPEGFASLDFARKHVTLMQPSAALRHHRSGQHPFDAATLTTLRQDLLGGQLQVQEISGDGRDQLTNELKEFVQCVRTGHRPRAGGEEGCAAIALATRILESIQTHAWDGAAGALCGPNAFAKPGATLFQPPETGIAA
jgi:predicted dehydrogenase